LLQQPPRRQDARDVCFVEPLLQALFDHAGESMRSQRLRCIREWY
jgi:hypothetical protein